MFAFSHPLIVVLKCRGLGAGTSCPKLVMGRSSERVVLQESPDILRFADKNIRNEEDRLYTQITKLGVWHTSLFHTMYDMLKNEFTRCDALFLI